MSQLLEWALENIQEWDEKWTHLRCSPCEVIYTVGNGWYLEGRGQSAEWVDDRSKDGISTEWVCLTTNTPEIPPETITRQQWSDAKGGGSPSNDGGDVHKLSFEEVAKDATEWNDALNNCGWLAGDLWEKYFKEKQTVMQFNNTKGLIRECILCYLRQVYKDSNPQVLELKLEIEESKKQLKELEDKLRELEGK